MSSFSDVRYAPAPLRHLGVMFSISPGHYPRYLRLDMLLAESLIFGRYFVANQRWMLHNMRCLFSPPPCCLPAVNFLYVTFVVCTHDYDKLCPLRSLGGWLWIYSQLFVVLFAPHHKLCSKACRDSVYYIFSAGCCIETVVSFSLFIYYLLWRIPIRAWCFHDALLTCLFRFCCHNSVASCGNMKGRVNTRIEELHTNDLPGLNSYDWSVL
jgi:hypothetical protein